MQTYEQKAGAWDGLKEAMNHMTKDASQECKKMASEFLALMQQVESKVESEQKQSVKCLECTKHMFCKLPERKVAMHQCK